MGRAGPIEILLVEDNPGDARLTKEALKEGRVPKNLSVVGDGVEALAYLKREGRHSEARKPDLILLDLNLPKKDGREVLVELKKDERLRRIPVIVLTTSQSEDDITQAYDLHASCYVTKSMDLDRFLVAMRAFEAFWLGVVSLP